ncbi:MAG: SpoIVB peptidase [Clostridiales bacterium]|nr:SpoIVB peptidase [Clostridiales bacterium]
MSEPKILKIYRQERKKFFLFYLLILIVFSLFSVADYIPDSISVTRGNTVSIGGFLPVTRTVRSDDEAVESFGNLGTAECGVYEMECRLLGIVPIKSVTVNIVEDTQVIPCGVPVGIYIETAGVYVADVAEVETADGSAANPSRHILQAGDYITAVDGAAVSSKEELVESVRDSGGKTLLLSVVRDGETIACEVTPVKNADGEYQIGVWVRDDLAGIGTLTYVTEEGSFGALGHSISDTDTSEQVVMKEGTVYLADILSIIKGTKGNPGELVGQIQYTQDQVLGMITENLPNGIFGVLDNLPEELSAAEAVSVGYKQEITEGTAEILAEIDGEIGSYEVEIESIDMNASELNKSLLFYVTDEELIEKTGGIIQGMSGSPILQNGKIIGAVTHVFVSDPREGYGIFIEDMLEGE